MTQEFARLFPYSQADGSDPQKIPRSVKNVCQSYIYLPPGYFRGMSVYRIRLPSRSNERSVTLKPVGRIKLTVMM